MSTGGADPDAVYTPVPAGWALLSPHPQPPLLGLRAEFLFTQQISKGQVWSERGEQAWS